MPLPYSSTPKQQRCLLHAIQLPSEDLLAFRINFSILKTRAEVFISMGEMVQL